MKCASASHCLQSLLPAVDSSPTKMVQPDSKQPAVTKPFGLLDCVFASSCTSDVISHQPQTYDRPLHDQMYIPYYSARVKLVLAFECISLQSS